MTQVKEGSSSKKACAQGRLERRGRGESKEVKQLFTFFFHMTKYFGEKSF